MASLCSRNLTGCLPRSNLKNVFSLRASTRLFKSLVPATLVMILGWDILQHTVLLCRCCRWQQLPLLFESQYRLLLATSGILLCWSASGLCRGVAQLGAALAHE